MCRELGRYVTPLQSHVTESSLEQARGLGVGYCILADSDRWGARKFTIGPNGSRKRPDGELTGAPAVIIGRDGVPPLATGKLITDQSPEHGGPGLHEDLCVYAAAAMSRLSPPASPEHARCMSWLAKHGSPITRG